MVLLRGLPGSGKSHFAQEKFDGDDCFVLSTDDFFYDKTSKIYNWNQRGLENAHIWNQERCRLLMERERPLIVIDNCNLVREDVVCYVSMAKQFHYIVDIIDVAPPDVDLEMLAERNKHGVPLEKIKQMKEKFENFSVKDVESLLKSREKESRHILDLRKKYRENIKAEEEGENEQEVVVSSEPSSGKVRTEVFKNDGQAFPVKVMVVPHDMSLENLKKLACQKVGLKKSKKCRLFDNRGEEIVNVTKIMEGQRVFVSHDGKDFIPMKLKQTAQERREQKRLKEAENLEKLEQVKEANVMHSLAKLPHGVVRMVDELYLGSGRDGRDVDQIKRHNFDTIINVAKDFPALQPVPDCVKNYLHVAVLDDCTQSLLGFIPVVVNAIAKGSKTLIHCVKGRSRSPAFVVFYLMLCKNMSALDALRLVKAAKNDICINPGFLLQLSTTYCVALMKENSSLSCLEYLEKFGTRANSLDEATHMWWSALIKKTDYYVLPGYVRNVFAQFAVVSDDCFLVELRPVNGDKFRFHLDIDCLFEEKQFESLELFTAEAMKDLQQAFLEVGLAKQVYVSGVEGKFRGKYKYGLHVFLDVWVTEKERIAWTKKIRSHLAHLPKKPLWTGTEDWSKVIDPLTDDRGLRCLGALRHATCAKCRKNGQVVSQDCDWCFGRGIEPTRKHVALIGKESAHSFSMFPLFEDCAYSCQINALKSIDFLNRNGKESADLMCKEYGLKVSRHTQHRNLYQFTYDSKNSALDNPLVGECRGMIAERGKDGWRCVALPFLKFFNAGDDRSQEFDWSCFETREKMDGLLIIMYCYDGQWQIATQNVPDASQAISGEQSVRDLFLQVFSERGYPLPSIEEQENEVYLFELVSDKCQVVVKQHQENVVLIGARDMNTLKELDIDVIAQKNRWLASPKFFFSSKEEVMRHSKSLSGFECEGFVVRDSRCNRLKIKSPSYVSLFHLKGASNANSVDLVELVRIVRDKEVEEVTLYFPFLSQRLKQVENALADIGIQQGDTDEAIAKLLLEKNEGLKNNMNNNNDDNGIVEAGNRTLSKREKQLQKAEKKKQKKEKKNKK